ncbi:hypothetical protein HAX54_046233, partial [Datura stramonium]|nr:hypothetical protein [Datura stramonium]
RSSRSAVVSYVVSSNDLWDKYRLQRSQKMIVRISLNDVVVFREVGADKKVTQEVSPIKGVKKCG